MDHLARPSHATTTQLAEATNGFSFAYIKELMVTSLMRSVAGETPWADVVTRECATLSTEMKTSGQSITAVSKDARAPFP